jgi:hypothetical protein
MSIHDAAIELYQARTARDAAKQALKKFRENNGECTQKDQQKGMACYHYMVPNDPDWCGVCQGSQPLWVTYQQSATRAATALRRLMYLCKKEVACTPKS